MPTSYEHGTATRETHCLHPGIYAQKLMKRDDGHEVALDRVKEFDRLGQAELLNKRIRESGQILHNRIRPSHPGKPLGGRGVLSRVSRLGLSRIGNFGSFGFCRLRLLYFRRLWGHNRRHILEC